MKYKVSKPEDRRFMGRTFDSKAECQYAMQLYMMLECGAVLDYICQPRVWLGVPENVYVPDFLVVPESGKPYYVDVKGHETQKFKRDKKLWRAYGRLELVIVKHKRADKFETVEIIKAAQ